jgi:hypothetical protein
MKITISIDDFQRRHKFLNYLQKHARMTRNSERAKFNFDGNSFVPYEGTFVYQTSFEFTLNISFVAKDQCFLNHLGKSSGVGPYALLENARFLLNTDIEHEDRLKDLIKQSVSFEHDCDASSVRVYSNFGNECWTHHGDQICMPLENLFIPNAEETIRKIDKFIDSRDKFIQHGVPYKHTVLLEGKPGMGKTSFIKCMAKKYKRNLYILSLSNSEMNERVFTELLSEIPESSILVFEDLDAYFVGRARNDSEGGTSISFSTLLNILDGSFSKSDGLLTFITANNIRDFDRALIRPGRIDSILHFGNMTREQFDHVYRMFHKESHETDDYLFRTCIRNELSVSALVNVLFYGETKEQQRDLASNVERERQQNNGLTYFS